MLAWTTTEVTRHRNQAATDFLGSGGKLSECNGDLLYNILA